MKKLIKFMIFIIVLVVLYFIYDYFTTIGYKNVKYAELEVFKQDVLNKYNVDEIEIYFSRPSLWIEINSEEKLNEVTIEKIKEKLKPIINKKIWTKFQINTGIKVHHYFMLWFYLMKKMIKLKQII